MVQRLVKWFWRRFVNVVLSIFPISLSTPLGTVHVLLFAFPSLKDDVCQMLLKLTKLFWWRKLGKYFHYLPLEKGVNEISTKLNPFYFNDAICQVLLKLTQSFWKLFFLMLACVYTISLLSSIGERFDPSFEDIWIGPLMLTWLFISGKLRTARMFLETPTKKPFPTVMTIGDMTSRIYSLVWSSMSSSMKKKFLAKMCNVHSLII